MTGTVKTQMAQRVLLLMLGALSIAACGAEAPADGPTPQVSPVTGSLPVPTSSSVPPTSAPSPSPAVTTTSLPTQAASAPIIHLTDQSISDGERFPKLGLEEYVTDPDQEADDLTWDVTGGGELGARLISGNLIVSLPSADWTGAETLRLEVCDPDQNCTAKEVVFEVRAENDAPLVQAGGQIIMLGESFRAIELGECATDEDNPDEELVWSVSGNVALSARVRDGMLRIEPPGADWQGSETLYLEACDPSGACGTDEAVFQVMARGQEEVEVTYIGNAGFMVQVGSKKLLVDALVDQPSPPRDMAAALVTGQPPFDGVDLILTTHAHQDHFSAERVKSYLEHNPRTIFVAPQDAASRVDQVTDLPGRIIPVRLEQRAGERTSLVVNGIGVECMFLSHGGDILNLGYLVTTEGRRIFHPGDMDPASVSLSALQGLGLPEKGIDVAFVAHFILSDVELKAHAIDGIGARYVVAMHYQFTAPAPDYELLANQFPEAIVFRAPMESWTLPE